jgi:membrane protease YdiL (CAAX protease family)
VCPRRSLYLRTRANLLFAILVHLLANMCGGIARDVQALSTFFVAEGLAAAVIVVLGGLRSTSKSATLEAETV